MDGIARSGVGRRELLCTSAYNAGNGAPSLPYDRDRVSLAQSLHGSGGGPAATRKGRRRENRHDHDIESRASSSEPSTSTSPLICHK